MTTSKKIQQAYNIDCIRDMARRVLPKPVFDFADGAAEDEITLRGNQRAFDDFSLLPRPISPVAERDLSLELFGCTLSLPLIIGPTGLSGLFHGNGELAAAQAACEAGIGFCLSHASVCTIEDLAQTNVTPRWMQVFIYRDRSFTEEHVERAKRAGYHGLVLTIDNQLVGQRERDLRNGFTIPPRFSPIDSLMMAGKLPWLWQMRQYLPGIRFGNYERFEEAASLRGMAALLPELLDPDLSWDDIAHLRANWEGPLIIKGIMHPDDAVKAVEYGVDGLVLSNHGGRQLDGAVPTALALPAIARAVDRQVPIMVDGGIRRGRQILIALALGASACLIARPQLWGLAAGGREGVSRVIEIYRTELDRAMGLCGVRRLADIHQDLLFSE